MRFENRQTGGKETNLRELLNLNMKTSVRSKTTRSYHHSLEACQFIFSEQVLQRKCVSSFQRGRRLWDSARQSPSKALCCVTLAITVTSLMQICRTRIYLNFLIVLRPSSDFIRIFICAGVGIGLISLCIYLHRCLKWHLELPVRLLPCSDHYRFSDICLSKISQFHLQSLHVHNHLAVSLINLNMLCDAQRSLTFNNCTLCSHCIYVFCIYLRTNSDLCHLQHKLLGFYSRDEKCLQRGAAWVFK